MDAAHIADSTSSIARSVAVEHLAPVSSARDADPVSQSRNRSKVADHQHNFIGPISLSNKTDGAVLSVVRVDPFEAGVLEIALPKR